ncbi:MAG: hypothetical protein NTY19_51845 [Planctomycetota bacterium]|nr:hypothetical protein [Planctomycetota bacterium]
MLTDDAKAARLAYQFAVGNAQAAVGTEPQAMIGELDQSAEVDLATDGPLTDPRSMAVRQPEMAGVPRQRRVADLNFGCPRAMLQESLERIRCAVTRLGP